MKPRTVCIRITLTERDPPDYVKVGQELAALTDRRALSAETSHRT
jgi:hypothetical protein